MSERLCSSGVGKKRLLWRDCFDPGAGWTVLWLFGWLGCLARCGCFSCFWLVVVFVVVGLFISISLEISIQLGCSLHICLAYTVHVRGDFVFNLIVD